MWAGKCGGRTGKESLLSFFSTLEESVNAQINMATCLSNAVFTSNYQGQESIKILSGSYPKCAEQSLAKDVFLQDGYSAKPSSFKQEKEIKSETD